MSVVWKLEPVGLSTLTPPRHDAAELSKKAGRSAPVALGHGFARGNTVMMRGADGGRGPGYAYACSIYRHSRNRQNHGSPRDRSVHLLGRRGAFAKQGVTVPCSLTWRRQDGPTSDVPAATDDRSGKCECGTLNSCRVAEEKGSGCVEKRLRRAYYAQLYQALVTAWVPVVICGDRFRYSTVR